jgi:hypothetical protein
MGNWSYLPQGATFYRGEYLDLDDGLRFRREPPADIRSGDYPRSSPGCVREELGGRVVSLVTKLTHPVGRLPDPDFEEFALDCIRLAGQERCPGLRAKLLVLAKEWMDASLRDPTASGPWRKRQA